MSFGGLAAGGGGGGGAGRAPGTAGGARVTPPPPSATGAFTADAGAETPFTAGGAAGFVAPGSARPCRRPAARVFASQHITNS